jgi:hypothetical protein
MRIALIVALAGLTAACTTPAQQCRLDATRDLRGLDRMIAETTRDVERGYRLVEIRTPFALGVFACFGPEAARLCADDSVPPYRHERLNVPAERAKLQSLVAQRAEADARARRALETCPQA